MNNKIDHSCSIGLVLLLAFLIFGLTVTLVTEVFSYFKLLEREPLLYTWATFSFLLLALLYIFKSNIRTSFQECNNKFDYLQSGFLYCIVVILVTLLISVMYPPNNWDSMTYHMARIAQWQQNHSVDFYPTSIIRQLFSAPWAEYAILNIVILTGSDRLANLVQWFAMIGSIVALIMISNEINQEKSATTFVMILSASLPMGILQSSSTQNDYALTLWLTIFVYFTIRCIKSSSYFNTFAIGVALGLALLTKATALLFAAPFLFWYTVASINQKGKRGVNGLVVIALYASLINLGHFIRNYQLFGNILGIHPDIPLVNNEQLSIEILISNFIRNLSLNIGLPNAFYNESVTNSISFFLRHLGIDPNDPLSTLGNTVFKVDFNIHEDAAGNFVHLLLLIPCLAAFAINFRKFQKLQILYLLCVMCGFVNYSLILKWQPWGSRLLLPFFMLVNVSIASFFTSIRNTKYVKMIFIIMILYSIPFLIMNRSRPIFEQTKSEYGIRSFHFFPVINSSRNELYFKNKPGDFNGYHSISIAVRDFGCQSLELILSGDDWEYPLHKFINFNGAAPITIYHGNVQNISRKIPNYNYASKFSKCAITSGISSSYPEYRYHYNEGSLTLHHN